MIDNPFRWCSIDPGDMHVGFATWVGNECITAVEMTPEEAKQALRSLSSRGVLELIAYEKFFLYGAKALDQIGSEFLTVQLIGAIKEIADVNNVKHVGFMAATHKRIYQMDWFKNMSPADKRSMPYYRNGGHAKDAWCVGRWLVHSRKYSN